MKKIILSLFAAFGFLYLISCNRSAEKSLVTADVQPGTIEDSTGFSTDTTRNGTHLNRRRFIRTALLKYKVNDVAAAVTGIERTVRSLGGFVPISHLENRVIDSTRTVVGPDSVLQKLTFFTEGFLVLRVPDNRLDSLLALLGPIASFTAKREVSSEDVLLKEIGTGLQQNRATRAIGRLTKDIDEKGRKLPDIGAAEIMLGEKGAAADEARLTNLAIDDAVQFSTVTISLNQDRAVDYTTIEKVKDMPAYRMPFVSRIADSVAVGWTGLEELVVFVAGFWPLYLLIGTACYFFGKQLKLTWVSKTGKTPGL